MLVKLLSLTAEGAREILQAVKAIRNLTSLVSLHVAKQTYDAVRDGEQPAVYLDKDHAQARSELNKFFKLDYTNEKRLSPERAVCLLTRANRILPLQGYEDEHGILVDLMRRLNNRINESILEAKPPRKNQEIV